jgi:hypothetical protein
VDRTWRLYKESFNVLSADVEILLFPVMSAVAAIAVAASFFIPLYRFGTFVAIHNGAAKWDDYATSGQAPQGFSADLIQGSLTRGRPREWQ